MAHLKLTHNPFKPSNILYKEDGLLDIFVGLGILFFVLLMQAGIPWLFVVYIVVFSPIWKSAKQTLTVPRLERLYPTEVEQVRAIRTLILLVVATTLTVVATGLMAAAPSAVQAYALFGLGLAGALHLGIVAFFYDVRRFYAYTIFTLILFAVGQLLNLNALACTALVGAVMLIWGTALLYRFMHAYPVIRPRE